MVISASLFSCKSNRREYVNRLKYNQIQVLHIDYMEGISPKEDFYNMDILQYEMALDVHMICPQILQSDIEYLNKIKAKYLCYQYENLDKGEFNKLYGFNGRKGLAFTMNTELKVIEKILQSNQLDFILIMSTIPGISGQTFNYGNIQRIGEIKSKYPNLDIHVDGGIDNRLCPLMRKLNVSLIVSGSYLANAQNNELMERICLLKYEKIDTCVRDVMIPAEFIQTVTMKTKFIDIMVALNEGKMPVVVEDEVHNFIGIITDGDARRGIIKFQEKVFERHAEDIVVTEAFTTTPDMQIRGLLYDLIIMDKTLVAIPVVENGTIKGMVDTSKLM